MDIKVVKKNPSINRTGDACFRDATSADRSD